VGPFQASHGLLQHSILPAKFLGVRESVKGLDENDSLSFRRLQGSHPTSSGSTNRISVTENPEQRFTNNAWTLNDTLRTGRLRERVAVGLHDISFGNHSCSSSVTVSLPCLPDGYNLLQRDTNSSSRTHAGTGGHINMATPTRFAKANI